MGASKGGNTLLTLNRNSPLGPRGTIISLPRDRVFFGLSGKRGLIHPASVNFCAKDLTQPHSQVLPRLSWTLAPTPVLCLSQR